MKLIIEERESKTLRAYLETDDPTVVSSRIAATELLRVHLRLGNPSTANVNALLKTVSFRELTPDIARAAGELEPAVLRSLDAIHLATALTLESELAEFITYDERLAAAARARGLAVVTPR